MPTAWRWFLLLLLFRSATGRLEGPRLVSSPLGEKRFPFDTSENHVVLYHEPNTSSVFVGAVGKLYYYNFENAENKTVPLETNQTRSNCRKPEDAKNYLTLVEKYQDKLLICGSNACSPTCWFWVNEKIGQGINAQGLAPFGLDHNALVLIDGRDIYSTIKKYQYNGRIPRFRRIQGAAELYTSDTVMNKPQFVKASVVKQDQPYNDKIYIFFREDNPDSPRNAAAPKRISRLAQLCKGDKGGSGSHSGAKWTTLLKATLVCVDSATDRHFNDLQDVFIVESASWLETKVYGLFSNEWDYSAVCVYSVKDISRIFQTSPLKGFDGQLPTIRPGQCQEGEKHTPPETFKVIDSHPEVAHKLKQEAMLFQGRHLYKQIGVHQVQAADGNAYSVLFLTTDKGTIHKVALLPTGATNVLEIQPFHSSAVIRSMIVDNTRHELFVASTREVVQIPMALCGAYKDTCESCVLARDPHCAWADGKCTSVYDLDPHENGTAIQALNHDAPPDICASSNSSSSEGGNSRPCVNITVSPGARYYLNCSMDSHRANYTWLHNGQRVGLCGSGHRHCVHFINAMTEDLYGHYACVSQEEWFSQTLVAECLMKPPETQAFKRVALENSASNTTTSFWLGVLLMAASFMLIP